jgi:two-component sensor histidine kinase
VFEVFKKPDKPITFVCDLPDTIIFLDVAIALGLILNELFSNAFKFALYQVEQPTLKVSISQLKDDYILTVSDNGPGMPEGFDYKKSRSLGIHIIRQLSRQIQGKMEYSYKNGSHFNIYFKNTIQ